MASGQARTASAFPQNRLQGMNRVNVSMKFKMEKSGTPVQQIGALPWLEPVLPMWATTDCLTASRSVIRKSGALCTPRIRSAIFLAWPFFQSPITRRARKTFSFVTARAAGFHSRQKTGRSRKVFFHERRYWSFHDREFDIAVGIGPGNLGIGETDFFHVVMGLLSGSKVSGLYSC